MITTSLRDAELPRQQVSVVSVCPKNPSSPLTSLPPLSPLSPSGAEIPEFEHQAKLMLERMDTMLNTVKAVEGETDPVRRVEVS